MKYQQQNSNDNGNVVLSIFKKNLNNKNKLIPFNINKNTVGETKYFPPASKE